MTVALRERHGAPVELRVLERRSLDGRYARRILLTVHGTGRPALLGISRLLLSAAPPAARRAVLSEKKPLGAVLIAHRVLRRIEPCLYLEVEPTPSMARLLRVRPPRPLYGRLARIHCGGVPAVELLEVLAP